jgi:hypothetical protein
MGYPEPFKFIPKFPEKYLGNVNQIVCRSQLEWQFFKLFDLNPSFLKWGSEEIIIPYFCELDKKMHRYFPDNIIIYKTKDDQVKKAICEIKPKIFCSPPPPPKRITKGYYNRANDYIKNSNKWVAAKKFCEENKIQFMLLTEEDLKKHGR